MINKECFTTEWIAQKSTELQYNDKNLIEKVIRAFSLLEIEDDSPFSKIVVNCPVPSITNTLILRFG